MVSDAETMDTNFVRGLRQPFSDVPIKSLIGLNKVSSNDKTHYMLVMVNRLQKCLLFYNTTNTRTEAIKNKPYQE